MSEERIKIIKSFREKVVKDFLDVLVLKSIKEGSEPTGYKIMKGLSGKLGILLSSGTLYSVLRSLERKGLVKSDMKSHRIYSLTPKGERFINALLSDQTTRQFLILLQRPLSEVEKNEKESP
jgi:DNA-binding PadR family transcriptional regulator